MKLKKSDWIIIGLFYLLTIIPLIAELCDLEEQTCFIIVFFTGFIPIWSAHTTTIAIRFKNPFFSGFWILMIVLNGLLYNTIINIWVSMIVSFLFYHLLRLIFRLINKEFPIPIFIRSNSLIYNELERRNENKRDILFTFLSFFCGLFLSTYALILIK